MFRDTFALDQPKSARFNDPSYLTSFKAPHRSVRATGEGIGPTQIASGRSVIVILALLSQRQDIDVRCINDFVKDELASSTEGDDELAEKSAFLSLAVTER